MFNAGTAYRNEMNKELRGQSFVTISVRLSNFIAQSGYTITSNAINFTRDVGNIYGIRITFGTSRPTSIYLAGKRYTVDADIFETNDMFEGGLSLSATNLLQYDVAGIEFGINELVFENDDILSTSRLNKVNPLSAELPEQTFTFSLHDYNGDYSWADRSSLLYAFQKKQPVRWKYGRDIEPEQLTDREEEELTDREDNLLVTDDYAEIPGGEMWLNTWTVGTDSITLTASSKLSFMDDMFYDGDAMSGKTPAEMAQAVQDYFNTAEASRSGQSVTVICNITDTTTDAPIPVDSCKNCLQLIANACRGALYQDRNGVIRIERLSDTAEDYTLGGINIMKAPVASKLEEVDVINISEASYDVSSTMTDVATVTITELNTDVYVTFDTPIDATETILLSNSNVDLVEAHSYSATLRASVAGEVTISAYPLLVGSVTHRAVGNANGTNIKNIENPLTVFNADYMAWYVDYFCNDIEYSITYRGDPCIDALDLIYIQDETLDKIRIVEEELKTSVGVGLDCTITARRIESNGVSTKGKTNYKSSVFGLSSADLKAQEALALAQNAISSVRIEYAYSNSATVAPTDGWTTETLPKADGLYIWQRTVTESESGETPSDAACISGADGTGISDIVITYQASDNGVSAPTGTWSSTIPSVSAGSYLWTRTQTITSDGNSTYSYSVARQGQDGADGTSVTILGSYNTYAELIAAHPTGDNVGDGYMVGSDLYIWNGTTWQNVGQIRGADGTDGLTYYVHLAYATSGDGEENFSTTAFDGATYLGTLTNTTSTGSTVPADYSWSLFKGENALTIQIESSDGTTFKTSAIDTILYASLYDGQTEVTASNYGTFRWYRDGGTTAVGTGSSLTVLLPTVEKAVYTVKLIDASNNVIASASITLTAIRDIAETYWFYYTSVTQTTPTKPTTITTIPPTGWDVGIEPDYVEGSTDYVYVMQLTVFTDESFAYTDPALSASYEAAKKAAADAATAQASADAAQATADAIPATIPGVNLSPFFSHDLTDTYNANDNPEGYWGRTGSYGWDRNSKFTFTKLEDGWMHVHIDNSTGTGIIRNDCCTPRFNPVIKPGTKYTFLAEFRNNTSTGVTASGSDFYIVQQSGYVQFWGANTSGAPAVKLDGIGGASTKVSDIPSDGSYAFSRFTKFSEPETSEHYGGENLMITFTFRANQGAVLDYDVRLSMYIGEYWGPYVPYVVSDTSAIRKAAEEAQETADSAQSTANTALTTANDKNTVYYDTPPTGVEFSDGDVWFDADNDNAIHVWSSDTNRWELRQVGEDAISNLAITNAKIQDATIQDAKIVSVAAKKVTADMITANSVETNKMNVRVIQDASGERFYLNLVTGEFRSEHTQTMQESINLLSENDLLFQAPATTNGDNVTLNAVVYKSGVDVARTFAPTCFSWYLITEEEDTLLGTGYSITVSKSEVGYNGCIRGVFQTVDIEEITDGNNNALTTRAGVALTARHAS